MDIEPIQNYRYFQRVAQLRSIAGYADKGWSGDPGSNWGMVELLMEGVIGCP